MITNVIALISASSMLAGPIQGDHIIQGDSVVVNGATVSAWARVNGAGKVTWVGMTMPVSLADHLPAPGSGNSGAFATLMFPAVVQQTTFFNHVSLGANPQGHATNPGYAQPNRYSAPHFDFHYNTIPAAAIAGIPAGLFFAPAAPERVPAGWAQPEPFSVPQMGRHSGPLSEFTATDHWRATMIAGFLPDASMMHFIEPMVTQELLVSRRNFSLPVPIPAVLGQSTRYPTEFVAHYDRKTDAYNFVFKGFEAMD